MGYLSAESIRRRVICRGYRSPYKGGAIGRNDGGGFEGLNGAKLSRINTLFLKVIGERECRTTPGKLVAGFAIHDLTGENFARVGGD